MTSPDLDTLKADWRAFAAVTGLDKPGEHHRCPFHEDRNGSFSLRTDEAGAIHWKCFAGCGQGTIVDAAALAWNCSPADAIRRLLTEYRSDATQAPRVTPPRPKAEGEAPGPVPDRERLHRFMEAALTCALEAHPAAVAAAAKRGLDLAALAGRFCVGFLPRFTLAEWPGWTLRSAWAMPIAGPDGSPRAVKLHFEEHPKPGMKSLWCPFGTEPPGKPRHGYATLWPAPEWFTDPAIILAPGELKALAFIRAGYAATSPTGGEGFRWTPPRVARLAGRAVTVAYDDDPAGHAFRDAALAALAGHASGLRAFTFGKKEDAA